MITTAAINPGKFDRRLTLRYPLATRDAIGASIDTWVDALTVWGSWLPTNGREFIAAQARYAQSSGIFRIRHRTDIDTTWRVVKGDDLFKIVVVQEIGRREYLDLIVEATNQTPGSGLTVLLLEGSDGTAVLQLEDATPLLLESA